MALPQSIKTVETFECVKWIQMVFINIEMEIKIRIFKMQLLKVVLYDKKILDQRPFWNTLCELSGLRENRVNFDTLGLINEIRLQPVQIFPANTKP